jgi:hypothetical protein
MLSLLFVSVALGANPFLDAASDKPVTAQFRGTEWGEGLAEDSPLTARVVTTWLARTTWGWIFKIEFVILKSKAAKKRVGIVEYASGSGAHADGYRLKRAK